MAAISMSNVIYFGNYEGCNNHADLLLYILKLMKREKNYCDSHKVGVQAMLGGMGSFLFKTERPFHE